MNIDSLDKTKKELTREYASGCSEAIAVANLADSVLLNETELPASDALRLLIDSLDEMIGWACGMKTAAAIDLYAAVDEEKKLTLANDIKTASQFLDSFETPDVDDEPAVVSVSNKDVAALRRLVKLAVKCEVK